MDDDMTDDTPRWTPIHAAEPMWGLPEHGQEPEQSRMLDLVFIQDATGSMGSYINSGPSNLIDSTKNIEEICNAIISSEKLTREDDLRISVISYRDHPPQDHSYIVRTNEFTNSIPIVRQQLANLYASGGGDGPEAVTAALHASLSLAWRPNAAKMVVLCADAPPHGIGEYGDGFPQGDPDGHDPIRIVRDMASKGITLFIIACEPALSGYLYGVDLFSALCKISGGLMLPLTTANLLAHAIVGSALEHLDMDRLIREVGEQVAGRLRTGEGSVDDIARELHEKLMLRGEEGRSLRIENIYRDSDESTSNVETFVNAPDIASAKPLLKKVKGSRFTEKYLNSRLSSRSGYRPALPARPGASTGITAVTSVSTSPIASTSFLGGPTSTSSFGISGVAVPSGSRRVLSDFKPFGAPAAASVGVFGSPVGGGGFSGSSFQSRDAGGTRGGGRYGGGGGMDSDDDEDDDDNVQAARAAVIRNAAAGGMDADEIDAAGFGQGVAFEKGAVTFEQARRIALGAAWRSMG